MSGMRLVFLSVKCVSLLLRWFGVAAHADRRAATCGSCVSCIGLRRLGACGPAGVLFCPVECVVGDFFPAVLTEGVVGAAGEGLELGDGR